MNWPDRIKDNRANAKGNPWTFVRTNGRMGVYAGPESGLEFNFSEDEVGLGKNYVAVKADVDVDSIPKFDSSGNWIPLSRARKRLSGNWGTTHWPDAIGYGCGGGAGGQSSPSPTARYPDHSAQQLNKRTCECGIDAIGGSKHSDWCPIGVD